VREKKILQYGSLAGWPYRIARGLRKQGINSSNALVVSKDVADLDRRLPYDVAVCDIRGTRLNYIRKIPFFFGMLLECRLVHYHGTTVFESLGHHRFEGPVLRRMNIPMVISFGGGDARIVSQARANNPYFYRELDEGRDRRTRRWLSSLSKHVRYAATDCEMAEYVAPYFEKVFTFRQPVDLEEMTCRIPEEHNACPVVGHIPTHPEVKGTAQIQAAVERLKAEGLRFEFRMYRQLTQTQVHAELAKCDVYVDELRCGSHGVTAVESMASGKPTITYIREDLLSMYPADLPLVNANPDTIYPVLKRLILDGGLRAEIGKKSRAYAEKYHAVDVVVRDLLEIYRAIGYPG